jgi:hypothetical protein
VYALLVSNLFVEANATFLDFASFTSCPLHWFLVFSSLTIIGNLVLMSYDDNSVFQNLAVLLGS